MWFPCGVSFLFFSSGTPPLLWELLDRTRNIFEMLSKYIYLEKCNCGFFWRVKKSVCAHAAAAAAADPLAADTVFWKVNRSQYVLVVSAKPAPISRNRWVFVQQDRGDSGKYGGASAPRAFFFFLLSLLSYLLKEALTGARTILGNVFPVFHLSLPSFLLIPSSFQLLQFTQQRSRFTLPPLPPEGSSSLAPSHRSHSLNSHLTVIFDRRRAPLTV